MYICRITYIERHTHTHQTFKHANPPNTLTHTRRSTHKAWFLQELWALWIIGITIVLPFNGLVTQEASCSCSCTFALKVADTKSWTLPRTKPWETLLHPQRKPDKWSSSLWQCVYAACVTASACVCAGGHSLRDGLLVITETTGYILSK